MGYRDAMIHGETNVGLGMVGGDSEEDRLIEENRDLRNRLEQAERQRDEARWLLRNIKEAIASLPQGALGYDGDDDGSWSIRDEFLYSIDEYLRDTGE